MYRSDINDLFFENRTLGGVVRRSLAVRNMLPATSKGGDGCSE